MVLEEILVWFKIWQLKCRCFDKCKAGAEQTLCKEIVNAVFIGKEWA
jgi:hypothetical protein